MFSIGPILIHSLKPTARVVPRAGTQKLLVLELKTSANPDLNTTKSNLLHTPLKRKQLNQIHEEKPIIEMSSSNNAPILARKKDKEEPWLLMRKPFSYYGNQNAGLEAYCGALYRLIIGIHQPKYRAIDNQTLLIKKIASFKSFSKIQANKDSLNNSHFAAAIVASYFFQEQDLHLDNIGIDEQGKIIRIDFNRSIWKNRESTHPLTADKIRQLPFFNEDIPIAPEWWPASFEISQLRKDKLFIRNKFKYLLKITLLDRPILQTIGLDHLTPNQETFIHHTERRRQELMDTLINMEDFQLCFAENYEDYWVELKTELEAYNQEFIIKIKKFDTYLHLVQFEEGLKEIQKKPKYNNATADELVKILQQKKQEYSNRIIDISQLHQRYQTIINTLKTKSPLFVETIQKEKRKKTILKATEESKNTLQITKDHVISIKKLIQSDQTFKIGFAGGKQISAARTVSSHASLQWSVILDAEKKHLNYIDALEDIKGLAEDALLKNNRTRDTETTKYYQDIIQKHEKSRNLLFSHPDLEIEARRILLELRNHIHQRKWIVGFWGGTRLNAFEVVPDRVYKQMQIITSAITPGSKITCLEALSKVRRLAREALANTSRSRDTATVEYYQKTAILSAFPRAK